MITKKFVFVFQENDAYLKMNPSMVAVEIIDSLDSDQVGFVR